MAPTCKEKKTVLHGALPVFLMQTLGQGMAHAHATPFIWLAVPLSHSACFGSMLTASLKLMLSIFFWAGLLRHCNVGCRQAPTLQADMLEVSRGY